MTVKEKIVEETIRLFLVQGIRLKAQDVAANIGISKKTVYKFFASKEELLLESVDTLFSKIKQKQEEILNDASLGELEKLRRIIVAMPVEYNCVRVELLAEMNEKYPAVFARMNAHLEEGWEETFALLDSCCQKGLARPVDRDVFKLMVVGSMEKFIHSPQPELKDRTYEQVQQIMIDILIGGIKRCDAT